MYVDITENKKLEYAAQWGDIELCQILLKRGAQPDVGLVATTTKPTDKSLELVNLFIESGADVNTKTPNQKSVLHFAAENGLYDVCAFLIKKGAQINSKDSWECTPLHYSVEYDEYEVSQILIHYGADVNAKDDNGESPIFNSLRNDTDDTTELLIEKGTDINQQNVDNETAKDFFTDEISSFYESYIINKDNNSLLKNLPKKSKKRLDGNSVNESPNQDNKIKLTDKTFKFRKRKRKKKEMEIPF